MLTKVRFKNYRSYTRETIISLEKSKNEILNDTNVHNGILKGCAFYGPNASGKTNALWVISILFDFLFIDQPNSDMGKMITLFNKEKTAYFEYTFSVDGSMLVYFFEFNRNGCVVKETLDIDGKRVLNRLLNSAESYITENRDYGADSVDERVLFLRTIFFNTRFASQPILKKWIDELKNSAYINLMVPKIVAYDSKSQDVFLPQYLDNYGETEINEFLNDFGFPYTIRYEKATMDMVNVPFEYRLYIERKNLAPIPFAMESVGNNTLFNILPTILTVVKNNGILMIDEFDSSLHNKLQELLVKYVFKKSSSCQLFFVSHATNLLKTSLLRPDQIYAVDFDEKGSFMKKFSDEHPRETQNLEKMYLAGVFGGIPLYEDAFD